MIIKIAIIGYGFVGKATHSMMPSSVDLKIYDTKPELSYPPNTQMSDLTDRDLFIVCVPTPSDTDGTAYLEYVKTAVRGIRKISNAPIILRSTVPVGTSDKFNISFWPEFLRERHWQQDVYSNKYHIFGINSQTEVVKEMINGLINEAYEENKIQSKDIIYLSTKEAELVKYVRNSFFALKVSFFNEISSLCSSLSLDFNTIRHTVTLDPRINEDHSHVPGPDGQCGYGGICLPKDTLSLYRQFEEHHVPSYLLKATLDRNNEVDRPQKDWMKEHGRAVI